MSGETGNAATPSSATGKMTSEGGQVQSKRPEIDVSAEGLVKIVSEFHGKLQTYDDLVGDDEMQVVPELLANMHATLSAAYQEYHTGDNLRDPLSFTTEDGKVALPQGFVGSICMMVFDCIGMLHALGHNVPQMLFVAAHAMNRFADYKIEEAAASTEADPSDSESGSDRS